MSNSKDKLNTLLEGDIQPPEDKATKPKKNEACVTCGQKKSKVFFDGSVSKFFKGNDVYIGDMDFKFADDTTVIIAEIKYVNAQHKFCGKKLTPLQCREYAALQGVTDNLGRVQNTYVFEAHETNKPYIAIVPFLKPTGNEKHAIDYLDYDNARLVYIDYEEQFGRWIAGDRYVGTEMRQGLKCV